jgi:L-cysteine/cystine lyase
MSNLATAPLETLSSHRQQFPGLQNKLYFNYGGQGPLPTVALDAIVNSYHFMQEHGPFSTRRSPQN